MNQMIVKTKKKYRVGQIIPTCGKVIEILGRAKIPMPNGPKVFVTGWRYLVDKSFREKNI